MIYETYTCAMSDGSIEYGYCFKEREGDDDCCTDAEIVVGVTPVNPRPEDLARIEVQWKKYEWMAKAIVAAPEAQTWEAV